jgi:D-amino-acid dehydrogenase
MRVIVLGAGIAGVSAAYWLARDGLRVTLIDRQPKAGQETSFANGGQISASHAEPWATSSTPLKALAWMGRDDAPLLWRWSRFDPALWGWGLRFLANCTEARTKINTERTLRIALYSRALLKALRPELPFAYDHREAGILHIYRDRKEFAQAQIASGLMRGLGLDRDILSPEESIALEPALAATRASLVGATFSRDDESGDAHLFTAGLALEAQRMGAVFQGATSIQAIETRKGAFAAVLTDHGRFEADICILALGSYSPLLVRPLGVKLPIVPAKGYSATFPMAGDGAPTVSITDDACKMVYSRLGERLRVAGTAEFSGYDASLNESRARLIVSRALDLFPKTGGADQVALWAGLRPVTPDTWPFLEYRAWNAGLDDGRGLGPPDRRPRSEQASGH